MISHLRRPSFLSLALALLAAVGVGEAFAQYQIVPIAIEGDTAPGAGGDAFVSFGSPVINATGEVAFVGNTPGLGRGIFSTTGGLHSDAFFGDPVPGVSGATLYSFDQPVINAAGNVAFRANTRTTTGDFNFGIFSTAGGLQLDAYEGNVAPGSGGQMFDSFNFPAINNAGEVAFRAFTTAGERGIYSTAGGLHAVAFQGDVAPGSGGQTFTANFDGVASINASGNVAFGAQTTPGPNDSGVFTDVGGLNAVAFEGNPAPGSGGLSFTGVGGPLGFNAGGDVAFGAGLSNGDNAIYKTAGGIAPVAIEGESAPGSGGQTFTGFGSPVMNSAGEVVFMGLTTTNVSGGNSGVYTDVGGVLQVVAFEGDAAPEGGGAAFTSFRPPTINASGDIAFGASTTPNANGGDFGLYVFLQNGGLEKIIAEGDVIEVATGDFHTFDGNMSFLSNSGNDDGRAGGFSDNRDLTFRLSFTDGSTGIFVARINAVPEPHSVAIWLLLGLSLAAFGYYRARGKK